jgi:hypothetical protein
VLDAHVRPGDKFEVYCLMELFALSGDLRTDVEALIVRRARSSGGATPARARVV